MTNKTNYLTRPLFITLEGIENSGKNTQLLNLIEFITHNDNGYIGDKYSGFVYHREPTKKTEAGIRFNEKLANHEEMSAEEATKLVIKDRYQHQPLITDSLEKGFHYICNRYFDSTGAYQVSQGANWKDIYNRHKFGQADGTRTPDITIFFNISLEESYRRGQGNEGKDDLFDVKKEFLKKLQDAYMKWFENTAQYDNRIILIINGEQSKEDVAKEMKEKLIEAIKNNYEKFKPER